MKIPRSLGIVFVVLAVLALVLSGCGSSDVEPTLTPTVSSGAAPADTPTPGPITNPDDVWERVQVEGKLVVGTAADYPPFEYYNENFQVDGFDIALINEIGDLLGLEVEISDNAFDGLADELALGQIDVAIAAISVTPQREEFVDFSHIYFVSQDGFLAAADATIGPISVVEDLASYRVGVQRASVYQNWLEDNLVDTGLMPETNLFIYGDISQGLPDLQAGRVDLLVMDKPVADRTAAEPGFVIAAEGLRRERYAIAMAKGQTTLRTRINQALVTLQDQGVVAELVKKYLDIDPGDIIPTPTPTPIPPQPTVTPVPPPSACKDGMKYIADLNYDDNNMKNPPVLPPGQAFQKGWRIQNSGTCAWNNNYTLVFVQGNQPGARMGGQPTAVQGRVEAGATYDMYINLTAPVKPGVYQGFWQMQNDKGKTFGQRIYVGIQVPAAPTPTPAPTATPSSDIRFWTDRDQIKQGECTVNHWRTQHVKEVYYYRDGQNWQDQGVVGNSDRQECPSATTNYYLRVVKNDNTVTTSKITIFVEQAANAPNINYFTIEPPGQIVLGQCIVLRWEVTGSVSQVNITRHDGMLWQGAPFRGSLQNCPNYEGDFEYAIEASGPGGISRATQHVRVVGGQPTPTPAPTSVPEPIIHAFGVDPTAITAGQCVTVGWSTGGGTVHVRVLRNGAVALDDAPLEGTIQDCLNDQGRFTYNVEARNSVGTLNSAEAYVDVGAPPPPPTATPAPEPPPTIEYFAVTSDGSNVVSQVNLGDCVFITWGFQGTGIARTSLSRNGAEIYTDFTTSDSYQDCYDNPSFVGVMQYQLKIDSEFSGSAVRDTQVQVLAP